MAVNFVQDNHSISRRGVLRGIHYQLVRPQGKLVRVVAGAVLDVAVDLRQSSPRFGCWVALELSAENHRQLWIPPGFGHGFAVRSEEATFLYKTTDYWIAEYDRSLRWNDPVLKNRLATARRSSAGSQGRIGSFTRGRGGFRVRRILLLGENGQLGWELQRSLAPLADLIALDRREVPASSSSRGGREVERQLR